MSRIARVVGPGLPHHIVHRGNRRERIFLQEDDWKHYLSLLNKSCERYSVSVWAWSLMPNHVHLLLCPQDIWGLAKTMQRVARNYSLSINQRHGWSGRLWESRYYSCVVEKESYLWAVCRYIEMNPVRAGLVSKPEEWQWSSARAHLLGEEEEQIKLYRWLKENDRKDYTMFVQREVLTEELLFIQQTTSSGRPLGKGNFVTDFERHLGRRIRPNKRGRHPKYSG